MNIKRAAWLSVQLLVVICIVALILGQVLGQPILFSYVTTGSMEPTLDPGDGFVALPPELAGEPSPGDVVVFEAEDIDGGGLTTHRIVGETEQGFETKGDANPFTDQDGGEPYVQEPRIVAVAWQPGGSVLTIPNLGDAVTAIQSLFGWIQGMLAQHLGLDALLGLQGVGYLILALTLGLYALDVKLSKGERYSRKRTRDTGTNTHLLVIAFAVLVMAGATAAMAVPADTHEFGIVSAEFESESPEIIKQGTTETYDYEFVNTGVVPTVVVLESASDNIAANTSSMVLSGRSAQNVSVSITSPPETGYYRSYLQEHRYLRILPKSVIISLHEIHPWIPLLVINGMIGIPFYLIGRILVGTGQTRFERRDGPTAIDRLRSRLQ